MIHFGKTSVSPARALTTAIGTWKSDEARGERCRRVREVFAMDGHRFDAFSKKLSRRTALKRAGAGGVATGLLGVAGLGRARAARAQDADGEAFACLFPFEAKVRSGPNAGLTTTGFLGLKVGADGSIDQGLLVDEDGSEISVVGQALGRAVTLVIGVQDGRYLFGTGGAPETIADVCAAVAEGGVFAEVPPLGGTFAGPEPGDIGDWITCCCPTPNNPNRCAARPLCEFCPEPGGGGGGTYDPSSCIATC
jgi:hypothetical protein